MGVGRMGLDKGSTVWEEWGGKGGAMEGWRGEREEEGRGGGCFI
jgi:hypothetical protein